MSKSTAAVILTSAARLAPWGDDAWRFSGAMQLVADGPDWLHARWNAPGEEREKATPFDSMVLRDEPSERAADIAVMALALLKVPGWTSLQSWWGDTEMRSGLREELERIAEAVAGELKLAVVETRPGAVPDAVVGALEQLGLRVVPFTEDR